MHTGTVNWYDALRGYGFIAPDNGGEEIFLRQTVIKASKIGRLFEGLRVSFEASFDPSSGKLSATELRAA